MFKDTRILVSDIIELLGSGMSIEDIIKEYPQLSKEAILEALLFASEILRRKRIVIPFS